MRRDETRDGIKLVSAGAAAGALFGMLLAVLTNQGTFTPTQEARPWPSPKVRSSPPTSVTSTPTWPTQPKSGPASGNTATPMATTPHPKGPTTTAPSTSANQTGTTGTSTPDPTTTTSSSTTTTEGAAVTSSTIPTPTPPPSPVDDAQSVVDDALGIGLPQDAQRGLEPQELVTRLFGPEPDTIPNWWWSQRLQHRWIPPRVEP